MKYEKYKLLTKEQKEEYDFIQTKMFREGIIGLTTIVGLEVASAMVVVCGIFAAQGEIFTNSGESIERIYTVANIGFIMITFAITIFSLFVLIGLGKRINQYMKFKKRIE